MRVAVKKHAQLGITFLKSCPIILYFFSLYQIFCLGLSKETYFWSYLGRFSFVLVSWIFSVTSKHFPNLDVNIEQASSVKSSKSNAFVLTLFCILGLGQNLALESFPLCRLVAFWTN